MEQLYLLIERHLFENHICALIWGEGTIRPRVVCGWSHYWNLRESKSAKESCCQGEQTNDLCLHVRYSFSIVIFVKSHYATRRAALAGLVAAAVDHGDT